MCSRDPELLDPELRKRMACVIRDHRAEYPDDPRPFYTCTVRTWAQQGVAWSQGRDTPGKIVTWALPGESPHNVTPSMAVDVAFRTAAGPCDWSLEPFEHLGRIAQRYGIEWGGDWLRAPGQHVDACHFQVPGWKRDGTHNDWPEMPTEGTWPNA